MKTLIHYLLMVLILIALLCPLAAQDRPKVEIGGGTVLNTSQSNVFSNWGDGWLVKTGIWKELSSQLHIGGGFDYLHYPFQGDHLGFPPPDKLSQYYAKVDSAQSSRIIQAFVTARVFGPRWIFRPFISVKAGLAWIDIGSIDATAWSGTGIWSNHFIVAGSGTSSLQSTGALAFGLVIPCSASIQLIVQSEFFHFVGSAISSVPITSTIEIGL